MRPALQLRTCALLSINEGGCWRAVHHRQRVELIKDAVLRTAQQSKETVGLWILCASSGQTCVGQADAAQGSKISSL